MDFAILQSGLNLSDVLVALHRFPSSHAPVFLVMASDDAGFSRVSFMIIPNTNAILIIRKRTNYLFLR